MKKTIFSFLILLFPLVSTATVHTIYVWDGYYQFLETGFSDSENSMYLGDTVQWLPLDLPTMVHTITSTNIPVGAESFDQIWQAPADTFFQYVPEYTGLYEYECTPHAVSFGMVGSFNVLDPSSIEDDFLSLEAISLYPNPAIDMIYFSDDIATNREPKYKIYAMNGEVVLTGFASGGINVSGLPKGKYIVNIVLDRPRYSVFIKQ